VATGGSVGEAVTGGTVVSGGEVLLLLLPMAVVMGPDSM